MALRPASGTKQTMRATLRVADGGRIVLPAAVRKQLGIEIGAKVVITVTGDEATLMSRQAALRRAQEIVRRYIPPGVSLSEELMAERKLEAERE